MEIWLACRVTKEDGEGHPLGWEVLGAYDERGKAVARCTEWGKQGNRFTDWIGRVTLNVALPDETCPWPEFYWVHGGRLYDKDGKLLEAA